MNSQHEHESERKEAVAKAMRTGYGKDPHPWQQTAILNSLASSGNQSSPTAHLLMRNTGGGKSLVRDTAAFIIGTRIQLDDIIVTNQTKLCEVCPFEFNRFSSFIYEYFILFHYDIMLHILVKEHAILLFIYEASLEMKCPGLALPRQFRRRRRSLSSTTHTMSWIMLLVRASASVSYDAEQQ
jgi:hypothetical protein